MLVKQYYYYDIHDAEGCALFLRECRLMSTLHIVDFIGIYFLPLPTIVLELLEMTLNHFLQLVPTRYLPLSLKRSDIASGLLYLHTRQYPVIHSNLSPQSVQLTSSLVPKIASMSSSQIIGTKLTSTPGSLWCMPPEAFGNRPSYGLPLDVFSFGHLALSTVTHITIEAIHVRR